MPSGIYLNKQIGLPGQLCIYHLGRELMGFDADMWQGEIWLFYIFLWQLHTIHPGYPIPRERPVSPQLYIISALKCFNEISAHCYGVMDHANCYFNQRSPLSLKK